MEIMKLFEFMGANLKEAYETNLKEGIREKDKGKQKRAELIDLIRCELDDLFFYRFDKTAPKEAIHYFY